MKQLRLNSPLANRIEELTKQEAPYLSNVEIRNIVTKEFKITPTLAAVFVTQWMSTYKWRAA